MDAGIDAGVDAGVQDAGCLEIDLADGGCLPLGFSNVCQLRALTVLLDGLPVDDAAGQQMAQALVDHCQPPPTQRSVASIDPSVVTSTGAPVVGRDQSLVCGGGSFFQKHVEWLEAGPAPVIDTTTSQFASVQRRDGGYVFIEPRSNYDGGFDFFVVELVRSQPTGPLSLVGYGIFVEGTRAVGWYVANRVVPDAGAYPDAWYVVRWTDVDHDGLPGAADTFAILGSGR